MRVLFVDDDSSVLEQAEIFLERADDRLDIETAPSAGGGLELLEEEDFDAIVSDYQMPGMDGLDFLETLREEKNSEIPFVILTGKGREEVAMKALNIGANRYIQKKGDPKNQYGLLARAIANEVEHRQAEKKFERSEEKYRKLIETSPDAIFLFAADSGKIIDANKKAMEVLGKSRDELLEMNHYDIYSEKSAEEFKELFEHFVPENNEMREIVSMAMDIFLEGDEGRQVPVELKTSVIELGENKIVQDIYKIVSEQKIWEETFDSIQDIYTLLSPNYDIVKINKAGAESFGKEKTEVVGKKCYEVFHDRDEPIEGCPCSKALKTGEPAEVEFEENGRHYIVTASPIFSESGDIKGFTHSVKDVTGKDTGKKMINPGNFSPESDMKKL